VPRKKKCFKDKNKNLALLKMYFIPKP